MLNFVPAVSAEFPASELVVGCPPELTEGPPELLLPQAASASAATESPAATPIRLVITARVAPNPIICCASLTAPTGEHRRHQS
jgi:hypothetical protein